MYPDHSLYVLVQVKQGKAAAHRAMRGSMQAVVQGPQAVVVRFAVDVSPLVLSRVLFLPAFCVY